MARKSIKTATSGNRKKPVKGGTNLHPGTALAARMSRNQHTQAYLAKQIGVDRSRITNLCSGKSDMTPDTAARLGYFYGTGMYYWLNLQALFTAEQYFLSGELGKIEQTIKPYNGVNTQNLLMNE